ncbi:MAG: hypothetical protein HOY78_07040 [Saccharothrix sp.]|nr:hypothetical protein [Saccharothrix sp.]
MGLNKKTALVAVLVLAQFGLAAPAGAHPSPRIRELGALPGGGRHSYAMLINEDGAVAGVSAAADGWQHAVRWDPDGRIVDLGADFRSDTGVSGMNEHGEVSGYTNPLRPDHAVRWDRDGRATILPTPPGYDIVSTRSIAEDGTVIGNASSWTTQRALRWGPDGRVVELATLPGGSRSEAVGINAHGEIAGNADTASGAWHAVKWDRDGRITDLGSEPGWSGTRAVGINDRGEVAGHVTYEYLLRWDEQGRVTVLAQRFLANAIALNDRGSVVGTWENNAARWDRTGRETVLQGLPGFTSSPASINNHGQVAGTADGDGFHAVRWSRRGAVTDLGVLPGHDLSRGYGINDRGVVVGSSATKDFTEERAVLWED